MWLDITKTQFSYCEFLTEDQAVYCSSTSYIFEVFLEFFQGLELGHTQASTMVRLGRSQVW